MGGKESVTTGTESPYPPIDHTINLLLLSSLPQVDYINIHLLLLLLLLMMMILLLGMSIIMR